MMRSVAIDRAWELKFYVRRVDKLSPAPDSFEECCNVADTIIHLSTVFTKPIKHLLGVRDIDSTACFILDENASETMVAKIWEPFRSLTPLAWLQVSFIILLFPDSLYSLACSFTSPLY